MSDETWNPGGYPPSQHRRKDEANKRHRLFLLVTVKMNPSPNSFFLLLHLLEWKTLIRKDVPFLAILTTGPLLVPRFVQTPPDPCNVLVVTLSNQTNQVLQGSLRVDQAVPSWPSLPTGPWTVLHPSSPFRLAPNTATLIRIPLPVLDPPATPDLPSRAVIVTVSGDVEKAEKRPS